MSELSYRMLNIGSAPAGLLGLEELFAELYAQGVTPTDEKLADLLLAGVRKHNFIPKVAVNDYASALRMEYTRYYRRKQQRQSGGGARLWHLARLPQGTNPMVPNDLQRAV